MGPRRRVGRGWPAALAMVAVVTTTTACHTYTPVTTPPPPGSIVRVQVPVRSALDNPNAPTQSTSIEGRVVDNGDTLRLATTSRMAYGAYREITQYDTLSLAPDQALSVEVREFSRKRSIILGVVLTAAIGTAAIKAFNTGGGSSPGPPDPPPPPPAIVSVPVVSSIISLFFGH